MNTPKFNLTDVFDACRKVFFPTPEEKAQMAKDREIKDLSLDLARAVRGVRVGEYTEEQQIAMCYSVSPLGGVPHLPRPLITLTEDQKEWRIKNISKKLADLGVDEQNIQAIITEGEEAMKNPRKGLEHFGY